MGNKMATKTMEIHKLKLAELRQEYFAHGLETKGTKQDLIHRLQAYLEEHAEEEANEDEEETKPIELPKKVVKITSEIPQTESMQKRSKKAGRAARFGISSVPTKGLLSDNKPMVNLDKPKERAQRFGLNVSSISRKSEDDEKLKKRKERFGIVTSSAGTGTTEDTEAKNRKRAEHFGIA
uniref:SAP domain-containing ribonucleoprotein n=1 Tax=Rhinopithecus bieti TaxID=61621 RepID=A0A2K6LU77_RHIBE